MLLQGIERQITDVTKSYQVRNAARELTNALNQAEANQRGFLLTGDRRFLAPYADAVTGLDNRVQTLVEMTAGDPLQAVRVDSIRTDIVGKMAEMSRAVELASTERVEEAQTLTETGMGARLMAEVTTTLEAFIAEEDDKLSRRNLDMDQTRTALVIALIAAMAAAVTLAYALLTRTQRQVSDLARQRRGLLSQNEALEEEIAARTRDIEEARAHAEHERERVETLLQDANHRIGNSLATVSSLLALQSIRSSSEDVRSALEAARLRVHAIASSHRRLRLGGDLDSASADEFLSAVLEDIAKTQVDGQNIAIRSEIDPIVMGARDATTLGILVGELVTNALKHAFPDKTKGEIVVSLKRDADQVPVLEVADDGVGLSAEAGEEDGGLGSVIVRQLAGQFGGQPAYESTAGKGLTVRIQLVSLDRHDASEA
ncbi:CHASE3 domain-containing protein [Devosia sp.]|uniref:sensor histidine kinase n=1 Tax=Devosia sp. TaxID=1871048 RepID=UPI002607E7A2|nr:CHASE3 domain-containing protein [Devosia sp.]